MVDFQSGNDQAFEGIYSILKPTLYSFIFRYTRDEQLSIDIVQDSFVRLQQRRYDFDRRKGTLKPYLFQIAYRLMVNKLNRRKKLQALLPFLTPLTKGFIDITDRLTIREAVAKLPEIQRAVILLYYYHDLTQEDISNILQIPIGTVKSRLHNAIGRLKDELGGDFNES
ncbi:RNA polymerase sigma factor [Bacillus sp. JCM 19034]|uniref:RNA polymerase sigma factor n=1 Tax=Bacillus sp. JCM 19034 TaxID=1481928 RepID=UPI000AD0B6E0|nr:RNA polymerase sigma factor [Bacillus sp. JCM 19034]